MTSCSDTDAGFAPVTSLGVVSIISHSPLAPTVFVVPDDQSLSNPQSSMRKNCLPDRVTRP